MSRFHRSIVSVAIALSFVNCGGGGSTPTTPAPSTPIVSSVTVTGPSSPARMGDSAQFTATAVMSNGTTQAVTSQATWQSSNTSVATVSNGGMVAAVGVGGSDIRATYQSVSGSASITVVQATFSLCGTIRDDSNNAPVSGVRVEILNGANAGKSATADASGAFCLQDLSPGSFTIRVSVSGYDNAEQTVQVNANTSLNVSIRRNATPAPNPPPSPTPPPPSPEPVNMICNSAAYPSSASCGRPSAVCNDNTLSCSGNRSGTCSSHTGVKCWLCPGTLCNGIVGGASSTSATVAVPWAQPDRR